MLDLNKQYTLNNGDIITLNGVSTYNLYNSFIHVQLYSSKEYDGQWNEKGRHMSNVYFNDRQATGLDIKLNDSK